MNRRIKGLEKELTALNGEIKSLSKVVRQAESAGVTPVMPQVSGSADVDFQRQVDSVAAVQPEVRSHVPVQQGPVLQASRPQVVQVDARTMAEMKVQQEPAVRKQPGDRDAITRDGRFATYLMSRDFHDVRPLRHEKHIQRNKAVVMIVFAVILLLWLVYRFF